MSTNSGWGNTLNNILTTTTMNSKILMKPYDASQLGNVINSMSLPSLVFGNWTEFTSSFMYYPINIKSDRPNSNKTFHLVASGISFNNISVEGFLSINDDYASYTLGEYYYPVPTSFLGYEPFSKCEVYLPFYGFTQLKILDIAGKYIQFRLNIDYSSGQAIYTISCSNTAINDTASLPYVDASKRTEYTNCRVLTTLVFQLGYSIPITNANFNNTVRNMATMAVKGATMTALGLAGKGESGGTETVKEVVTARNPITNRQVTMGTRTETHDIQKQTYSKGGAINTAVQTATSILSNISAHGSSDKPNNSILNGCAGRSIAIVVTSAVPTFDIFNNATYKHLVGLPNGTCAVLNTLTGYTKVSNVHIEGTGFGQATSKELAELESLCYDGIIL